MSDPELDPADCGATVFVSEVPEPVFDVEEPEDDEVVVEAGVGIEVGFGEVAELAGVLELATKGRLMTSSSTYVQKSAFLVEK